MSGSNHKIGELKIRLYSFLKKWKGVKKIKKIRKENTIERFV